MKRYRRPTRMLWILLALAIVTGAGCSSEGKKNRHLKRGDTYFEKERFDEAVIEYMNALRVDASDPHAIRQLGLAHYALGDFRKAVPFLIKAQELEPDNMDIHLKLGTLYLWGRKVDRARKEALTVLAQEPSHFDALLLLADTAFTAEQIDDMLERLATAEPLYGDRALFHVAKGNMHLRSQDLESAENAYTTAVEKEPESPEAHLALAQIYKVKGDREQAEQAYEAAANLSPKNARPWIKWAAFKEESGEFDEARQILKKVTADHPDSIPALVQLARIAFAEKRHDECLEFVADVLKREPRHFEARLLRAAVRLARRETDQALEEYQTLATKYPKVAQLRYQLALAHLQKSNIPLAIAELEQAVELKPAFTKANLLLAELKVRTGRAAPAIEALKEIIAEQPDMVRPHFLLGMAYRVQKMPEKAIETYRRLQELAPDQPQWSYLIGVVRLQQDRKEDAVAAFEASLKTAPTFVLPLVRLISMDIRSGHPDAALARMQKQVEIAPESAALRYVLAKLYVTRKDLPEAKKAVQKAIELQPDFIGAYRLLSKVYAAMGKTDEALDRLDHALEVNPDDTRSLMVAAALRQRRREFKKAADMYERVLALNDRSAPAVNNLAYLYSEHLGKLDRAYELGLKAKDLAPDDPFIADTLGWILYRRGDYKWALNLLQDSVEQLPDQPEILYHIGKVYFALGMEEEARESFAGAVESDIAFAGSEDARNLLDVLTIDLDKPVDEVARATIEKVLADDPANAAALVRMAAFHVQQDQIDKAVAAYDKALTSQESYLPAVIGLASVHARHTGNTEKAFELAQQARQLAPQDPHIAHKVGWIALQNGNYKWALSLLQESGDRLSGNPQVLMHQGMAHYMLGDVDTARRRVGQALQLQPDFAESAEATRFLTLTEPADSVEDPDQQLRTARSVLEQAPDNLPARLVIAEDFRRRAETDRAVTMYEDIVASYPDFAPASATLADLYLRTGQKLDRAFDLAMKARTVLANDTRVAAILGKILYQREDFDWAFRLLESSADKRPDDAEILYYLGMTCSDLKKDATARDALSQALELKPEHRLAPEARKTLKALQQSP